MIKLTKILNNISSYYQKRELLIKESRLVLRNSKQAIFCVHRHEFKNANNLLGEAKKIVVKLNLIFKKEPRLLGVGAWNSALQEYGEAVTFYEFMKNGKVPLIKEIDDENYLMGLCDLTGEIAREAVISATKKDKQSVHNMKTVVEDLFGEFIKLNITNNELRKKTDSIKWNLKKIEDLLYDLR